MLPELLDAIGFERGILLGHSDGASIATIYAGGVQDHRVRGLVLIAPHFFVEPVALAGIADAQRPTKPAHCERAWRGTMETTSTAPSGGGTARGWTPSSAAGTFAASVGLVSTPMLVMQGADDQYATMAQIDSVQEDANCPVSVAVIPYTRHAPHLQRTRTHLGRHCRLCIDRPPRPNIGTDQNRRKAPQREPRMSHILAPNHRHPTRHGGRRRWPDAHSRRRPPDPRRVGRRRRGVPADIATSGSLMQSPSRYAHSPTPIVALSPPSPPKRSAICCSTTSPVALPMPSSYPRDRRQWRAP